MLLWFTSRSFCDFQLCSGESCSLCDLLCCRGDRRACFEVCDVDVAHVLLGLACAVLLTHFVMLRCCYGESVARFVICDGAVIHVLLVS